MIARSTTSNGYVFFQDLRNIPCEIHPDRSMELSHLNSCEVMVLCNTQTIMFDEQDLSLQKKILQSVTARVPVLILQRVEENFPALRENTVSDVYMHAQKTILFTYSWNLHGQSNKMLSTRLC